MTVADEVADDEGFEKFEGHLLGETALIEFEVWTDHDNGTAGVIHTFTEQVLAEAALFTFEHVGEGAEFAFVAGVEDGFSGAGGVV